MKTFLRWLIAEYFSRVVLEFIWLMCSVALGMAIIAATEHIPYDRIDAIATTYGAWLIQVLWLAAMLRYIVAYGLDWLDARLDAANAQREENLSLVRSGFVLALRMIFTPKGKNEKPE